MNLFDDNGFFITPEQIFEKRHGSTRAKYCDELWGALVTHRNV